MEEVKQLIRQAIEKRGMMYMYYCNTYIGLIDFNSIDRDMFKIQDSSNGHLILRTNGLIINFDKVEID